MTTQVFAVGDYVSVRTNSAWAGNGTIQAIEELVAPYNPGSHFRYTIRADGSSAHDQIPFTVRTDEGFYLEPVETEPVRVVRRCIECGLEMTGTACQWCGGF